MSSSFSEGITLNVHTPKQTKNHKTYLEFYRPDNDTLHLRIPYGDEGISFDLTRKQFLDIISTLEGEIRFFKHVQPDDKIKVTIKERNP